MVQSFCDISLFVDAIFFLLFLIPFYGVVSFSSYFDFISFYFYFTQGTLFFSFNFIKKIPFLCCFQIDFKFINVFQTVWKLKDQKY